MPPLETGRLLIRTLTTGDLDAIHQLLDVELAAADFGTEGALTREERRQWLQWTVLGYEELARLHQPPYGERAIILRLTRQLIGACGLVPCLDAFEQLPGAGRMAGSAPARLNSTELGLYWAITPAYQRQGYATEAVRAMVDYAFTELRVRRLVATTTHDNAASIGVMRRLGMRIERNPYPEPPWLQVVGILDHPEAGSPATHV